MYRVHLLVLFLSLPLLHSSGQELPATLLLKNQTVVEGNLLRRQAGTTVVQFIPERETARRSLNLDEIDTILFDISAFQPGLLQQAFVAGRYEEVIDGLKGRIVPYFSYADLKANSNRLVTMFIQSLYRTGNSAGVNAARQEVEKYAAGGEVRRVAELLFAMAKLEEDDLEAFDDKAYWFRAEGPEDPLAPLVYTGLARRALKEDDWKTAYPLYARIITQTPLATPWVQDALYQTARYHQLNTNLAVAHQISQELELISSDELWKRKATDLRRDLEEAAERAGIELVEFGAVRGTPRRSGAAEIDYQKRQRELEESTNTP